VLSANEIKMFRQQNKVIKIEATRVNKKQHFATIFISQNSKIQKYSYQILFIFLFSSSS